MGIVTFTTDYGDVLIEVDDNATPKGYVPKGAVPISRSGGQVAAEAVGSLGTAMGSLKAYVATLQDVVGSLAVVPKEITIELGIKVTADAGIVIAKAGTEGSLTVTLTWEPGGAKSPAGGA